MKLSERALEYPRSGIRAMGVMAEKYQDVISLGIGEPGFTTPANIIEAAADALRQGYTKYTPNNGLPELRAAIAAKLERDNGLAATADNVIVTTGAGEAIMLALLALVNPGDEVILPNPAWPNYQGQILLAGAERVSLPTYDTDRFHVKAAHLEKVITERSKVLIINTPSNPTGAVLTREELEEIAEVVKKNDLYVIADEPYEKIIYDGRQHVSIGSLPQMAERVITVNSFSKTYAMTGWRIGYAHGSAEVIARMTMMEQSLSACVNAAAQKGAVEALLGPQDAAIEMVAEYGRRRDYIVAELNKLPGVECWPVEGAFYAFANVSALGSSEEVAKKWLHEAQVVTVPGTAFGSCGEGYVRIGFCASFEDLKEAMSRLKRVLG